MAIEFKMDGKVLCVKGGSTVGTLLHGTYTKIKGENRILFESEKLSYYLCWDYDGDDVVNFRRELVNGEFPKPIENAAYFDHTENALTLIGGAMVDEKPYDTANIKLNGSAIDIEMLYGAQQVQFNADYNNGVLSDMFMTVDGEKLEISEDGSISLSQQGDILLCEGGDLFSDLPDRIHIVSDTEIHFTYGEEVWAITYDLTDDGLKKVKKTKL